MISIRNFPLLGLRPFICSEERDKNIKKIDLTSSQKASLQRFNIAYLQSSMWP